MNAFLPLGDLMAKLVASVPRIDAGFRAEHSRMLRVYANCVRSQPERLDHSVSAAIVFALAPPQVSLAQMEVSVTTLLETRRETQARVGLQIAARPITALLQCRNEIDERQTARIHIEVAHYPGSPS